ncbi:hypothetical protein PQR36_33100 [Paraburkholderia nemoris]|uniref:hypothetical protein n=1 Tax=Paraburkholderia nemoris TaxID=2793076 RepID=UPI0038B785AA
MSASRPYAYNRIGAVLLPAESRIEHTYPVGLHRVRAMLSKSPIPAALRHLCGEVFLELKSVEYRRYETWFKTDSEARRAAIDRHLGRKFVRNLEYRATKMTQLIAQLGERSGSPVPDVPVEHMASIAAIGEAERACRPGAGIDTLLRQSTQFWREVLTYLNAVRLGQAAMPVELQPVAHDVFDDDGTFSSSPCDHLNIIAAAWLPSIRAASDLTNEALSFGIPLACRADWMERMYFAAAVGYLDAASLAVRSESKKPIHTSNVAHAWQTERAIQHTLRASEALRLGRKFRERTREAGASPSPKEVRSETARGAALIRHANSPKGQAKAFVFERWQAWQAGKENHKSNAAFARAMLGATDALDSSAVIEGWCRAWRNAPVDNA